MMENFENELNMKELQKMGIKIDWLPKNLRVGAMFQMNSLNWVHIGKQKVIMVLFDDEAVVEFKA